MAPKHLLPHGYQSWTVVEPVKEILLFLAAIWAGGILWRINRWRYCLREGWWPDRKRAIKTLSFLLLICFASRETLWCLHTLYTEATRSCIGGASRIVSLMTWKELDRGIERIVSVTMVVASLAALSMRSLSGIAEWPGIHWIKIEDEMELMELWMENVRGLDEMMVSHRDLLSVQRVRWLNDG